jgi:DNA-binding NarL/FixJ family response regulator
VAHFERDKRRACSGFRVAAMRCRTRAATLGDVPLRCLIVDDNASFRTAATALLEREGLTVVGTAANGAEALAEAQALRPDVVLLDIALGSESGFDVARRLAEAGTATATDGSKIILISTHSREDFADLIDAAPAIGFVPKAQLSAHAIRRLAGPG